MPYIERCFLLRTVFFTVVLITEPPSAPENVIVVAISPREILATWSPPTDHGGRFDLYYEVKISDPQILGEFTPSVYLTNITTRHVFPELTPFTAYCVRVTAHNGVSDQDPDRTHLRTVESCTETPEDGELIYQSYRLKTNIHDPTFSCCMRRKPHATSMYGYDGFMLFLFSCCMGHHT